MAPNSSVLSEEELSAVAFHAFPDSMSMELHAKTSVRDTCFFFRVKRSVRQSAPTPRLLGSTQSPTPASSAASAPPTAPHAYLYGFVFCRQRQDETLRRGGEQISVVVLSEHPFSSVLRPLSQVVGPLYFSHGEPALQQVYQEVCTWPAPTAAAPLQLQVSIHTLPGRLPPFETLPYPSCKAAIDLGAQSPRVSGAGRSVSAGQQLSLGGSAIPVRRHRAGSAAEVSNGGAAALQRLSGGQVSLAGRLSGELQPASSILDAASIDSLGPGDTAGLAAAEPIGDSHALVSIAGEGAAAPGPTVTTIHADAQLGAQQVDAMPRATSADSQGGAGGQPQPPGSPGAGAQPSGGPAGPQSVGPRSLSFGRMSFSRLSLHSSDSAGNLESMTRAGGPNGGGAGTSGPGPLLPSPSLFRRMSMGVSDPAATAAGAFSDVDVFTPLQAHLTRLWQLWEMVLCAKPVLVVGPSPADCSSAVAALISLVAPLPYAPDFRPYYTIHDTAFAALAAGALPGPHDASVPTLMGITNLYFIKAMTHWPNIISVGRKEAVSSWATEGAAAGAAGGSVTSLFSAAGAVKALRQRSQGAQVLMSGHVESIWSRYKAVTKPDQTLLIRLLQPKPGDARSKLSRLAAVNSEALRRHFHDLTTAFLAPFSRYFEPGADGFLPPWDEAEFLFTIRNPTTPPPPILYERVGGVTSALVELYGRFVGSTNFRGWFLLHRQKLQHLEAPSVPGHVGPLSLRPQGLSWFGKASKHLDEVQLINLFFELEGQLRDAVAEAAAPDAQPEAQQTCSRLRVELVTLFLGMAQPDLQLLCVSAPSRRDLLLTAAEAVLDAGKLEEVRQICVQLR